MRVLCDLVGEMPWHCSQHLQKEVLVTLECDHVPRVCQGNLKYYNQRRIYECRVVLFEEFVICPDIRPVKTPRG